jgi:hypothetical protein
MAATPAGWGNTVLEAPNETDLALVGSMFTGRALKTAEMRALVAPPLLEEHPMPKGGRHRGAGWRRLERDRARPAKPPVLRDAAARGARLFGHDGLAPRQMTDYSRQHLGRLSNSLRSPT